MTDKELADALVSLGFLRLSSALHQWDRYRLVKADGFVIGGSYDAVRDWRVAGAVMEKTYEGEWFYHDEKWMLSTIPPGYHITFDAENASLPRAIIEMHVLEHHQDSLPDKDTE